METNKEDGQVHVLLESRNATNDGIKGGCRVSKDVDLIRPRRLCPSYVLRWERCHDQLPMLMPTKLLIPIPMFTIESSSPVGPQP